jgi:thiol-disulfide isomerase/thioredoxin
MRTWLRTTTAVLALAAPAFAHPAGEPALSPTRAAFYRKAFPTAVAFVPKRVADDLVPFEDRGNETYVEVMGPGGVLLGYLRDFSGPVTTGYACPCHPLALTLAYDASIKLTTILSEAPLEKYGHVAMTAEDMARLIALAKAPPEKLSRATRTEDMVDAVTGATRSDMRDAVVESAALSTRRVAALVKDSARMIRGGALAKDQLMLREILQSERNPVALATRVAAFLPQAESPDVRSTAFDAIAHYYGEALRMNAPRQPAVETRLLEAATRNPEDLARSCQQLADRALGLGFVGECIARLEPQAAAVPPTLWQLLRGTAAYEEGRADDALPALRAAAAGVTARTNPQLHLRLVQALSATGHKDEACAGIKPLFREQPKLPGVEASLALCPGSRQALADSLRAERRQVVATEIRQDAVTLPPLSLVDDAGKPLVRDLAREGKPTILIFFATWCPHCQHAFPEFRALADTIAQDPKLRDALRLVAVRTYGDRDVESWADFASRFEPNFPVWADELTGTSLRKVASALGLPAGIPRLLVVDAKGVVRFVVEADQNRELGRELLWAAEAVVAAGR